MLVLGSESGRMVSTYCELLGQLNGHVMQRLYNKLLFTRAKHRLFPAHADLLRVVLFWVELLLSIGRCAAINGTYEELSRSVCVNGCAMLVKLPVR